MVSAKGGREKSNSQHRAGIGLYATVAFVSFLCAVAILAIMLWKAQMLVALGLIGNLYFVVLIPLGLAVASFLFGVLQSHATYTGKQLGGHLRLGGPVVAFFLVLIAGYRLQPASNFPFTVYVHGPGGYQDLALRGMGYVRIDTGGLPRKAAIGNDGEAFFAEMPANFRGQEVNISLDAPGYELADPKQKLRLDSNSFYLEVKRRAGRVAGRVHDESSKPLGGATITLAGLTATTDATGYFQLVIPGEQLQPELSLQVAAPGYASVTERVVPNSNEMTITLHRQD